MYEFGPFLVDEQKRLLLREGRTVPLTSKSFDTLLALVENPDRVVDKDELLKRIWPDTVVEERNLAVSISTLRKALGETPDAHEYIVTVPGRGYRFVAPVRERPVAAEIGGESARPVIPGRRVQFGWGLCVAAVSAAFALGWFVKPAARQPSVRFSTITNFAGVEAQPSFSPDGRFVAFVSDRGGQYDIYVMLVTGGSLVRVTNDPNVEARPRWSPDGTKLLYARLNDSGFWDVWAAPSLGGAARRLVGNAADPAWSPDGRRIVYANPATGGLWNCDANGTDPRQFTSDEPPVHHRQPAYSRDGRRVAFVRRRGGPYGELAVADVPAGRARPLAGGGVFVGSPAWSGNGRSIYFASGRSGAINIWRIDANGGIPEQVTVGQGDDADLDVSAHESRLVFSTYRININLQEITLDTRQPGRRWLTFDGAHSELGPAYSRDGSQIAYFTNRRGAENESIWVMNSDGTNPAPVVQDERLNIQPRWSADGRLLIYGSRAAALSSEFEIRRVPIAGGAPEILPARVTDYSADVGPRGDILLGGAGESIEVFEQATSRVRPLGGITGALPRWSPDGKRIATLIPPRARDDSRAGVWVYEEGVADRQVFRGWAAAHAWSGPDTLLVLQGKPDLNGALLRFRLDGSAAEPTTILPLIYSYWHNVLTTRFDAHPSGGRIVAEGLELHQADISMIEGIR